MPRSPTNARLAAQIEAAQAQLQTAADQPRLYRDPRADRRQDQRDRSHRRQRRLADQRDPGEYRQPGSDVCALSDRAAHRARSARTATPTKGGFSAVVIKLRLPDGEIYEQDRQARLCVADGRRKHRHGHVRGVVPNPLLPGMKAGQPGSRELTDGEFVTVLLEGVQPIDGSGDPARRGAVRSAGRLRLRCRCPEQGAESAASSRANRRLLSPSSRTD